MKICEWCSGDFKPNVSYQKYCSVLCREEATKKKINEKYQKSKVSVRAQKVRRCSGGCNAVLSMYNSNGFCSMCLVNNKKVDQMLKELKGLFTYEKE